MDRTTIFGAGAVLIGVTVFACSGEVLEAGETNQGVSCAAGQRQYNGACREICETSSTCPQGMTCTAIDDKAVCLDNVNASQCAYLESDTQCYGVSGYYAYSSRSWDETWFPYESTPYADPTDITPYDDPYFDAPYSSSFSDVGCAGNAEWRRVPRGSDPACTRQYQVTRCRRQGRRCVLVPGRTQEFPSP